MPFCKILFTLELVVLLAATAFGADRTLGDTVWYEVIKDKLQFTWNVIPGDPEKLQFGIKVEGDVYGSFGISSSGMVGPMVACYAPDRNASAALCVNCIGKNYNVSAATQETEDVSAFRMGSTTTFSGKLPTSVLQLQNKTQRIIFAYGPWQASVQLPGIHSYNATAALHLNLFVPPGPLPSTTTTPPSTTASPSHWLQLIDGKLGFKWQVLLTGDTEKLKFWIKVEGDVYGSFGISSSGMVGPMVACYPAQSRCVNCLGINYDVNAATQETEDVTVTREGSTTIFSGKISASVLKLKNEEQRIIFAVGSWRSDVSLPGNHKFGDTAVVSANLFTGSASILTNNHLWARIGFGVALVLTGGIVLLGFLTNRIIEHVWPAHFDLIFRICGVVFVIAMCVMIQFISVKDYEHTLQIAPHGRALAVVALYPFILLIASLWKHFPGFPFWWSTSWERIIPMHTFLSYLMFICATAHFIVMACFMIKDAESLKWFFGFDTQHYIVFAFAFWCIVAIVSLTGLLRRRIFSLFKYSHFLLIVAMAFVFVHSQAAIESLSIPLFVLLIDYIQRFVSHYKAKPQLESAVFNAGAQVVTLRIRVMHKRPPPGSHALIRFCGVSPQAHPFDIASFKDGVATMYVNVMGKSSWTRNLAEKSVDPQSLGSMSWIGPYGALAVPLTKCTSVAFIAEGIGMSFMLSLLEEVAEGRSSANRVTIVWIHDNPMLIELMGPLLQSHIEAIDDAPGVIIQVKAVVHCLQQQDCSLNSEKTPLVASAQRSEQELTKFNSEGAFTIVTTSPNLREYIEEAAKNVDSSSVAIYVSASCAVSDQVRHVAKEIGAYLHAESYDV